MLKKNKKGIYIPALAFLAIVIILFIIYSSRNPEVKKTTEDYLRAGRGQLPINDNPSNPPQNQINNSNPVNSEPLTVS